MAQQDALQQAADKGAPLGIQSAVSSVAPVAYGVLMDTAWTLLGALATHSTLLSLLLCLQHAQMLLPIGGMSFCRDSLCRVSKQAE